MGDLVNFHISVPCVSPDERDTATRMKSIHSNILMGRMTMRVLVTGDSDDPKWEIY